MAVPDKTQLLIIGGGPAGYVAAIRAAQLGMKPFLVEKENLGGICLNHGCIPSKALLAASELADSFKQAGAMGINATVLNIDGAKLLAWKDHVVASLRAGIERLFEEHRIDWVRGVAKFTGPNHASITTENNEYSISFDQAIIATGSKPGELSNLRTDGQWVIGSREALALSKIPKEMIVVGGGYIGMELSNHFAKVGTKITIVEFLPSVLTGIDPEAAELIRERFDGLGVRIFTNTQAQGVSPMGERVSVKAKDRASGKEFTLEADKVLVCVGNTIDTSTLGLENTKVQTTDKGFIKVDAQRRTTEPHIFAAGDVTGNPMLAHKAFMEGRVAAEAAAGLQSAFDQRMIPSVVFTDPEIAYVGLQEHTAKAQGIKIKVGKFPLKSSGRAWTRNHIKGFVKVIADEKNKVLGVTIASPEAGEMINEATLAIELGATAEDLALTIRPHPTFSESLGEAAEAVLGRSIHLFQPPK